MNEMTRLRWRYMHCEKKGPSYSKQKATNPPGGDLHAQGRICSAL